MPWARMNDGHWEFKGTGLRIEGEPEATDPDRPGYISKATARLITASELEAHAKELEAEHRERETRDSD